jgi:hypothetical protein
MKYPIEPCPECGFGDAEEDAKGVGLILGFHPQDPNHKRLPGTIFFIGCSHCQYVGPIVLCPNGLSEKKVIAAWNKHIRPGSTISTADLILELSRREGIESLQVPPLHVYLSRYWGVGNENCVESKGGVGPAKILVMKEESE